MPANNVLQLLGQTLIAVVQAPLAEVSTVVEESVEYTASTERVLESAEGNPVLQCQLESACVAPLHSASCKAVGDTGFVEKELPIKLYARRPEESTAVGEGIVRKPDLVVRPHLECAYQSYAYKDWTAAGPLSKSCVCGVSVISSRQCLLLDKLTTQTMCQCIEG